MANEMVVTDAEIVSKHMDVLVVQKCVAQNSPRCVICFQREGNPGDCDSGERFMIGFGAAGGIILCGKALMALEDKITNRDLIAALQGRT